MNIDQIRSHTKGIDDKIFLNSAGSSLSPRIVLESTINYLQEEEVEGGYKMAELRANEISEFYTEAGRLINCSARNIAFCTNATDAYNKALSAIPFQNGDVIITTNDDYTSNQINFISLVKRDGIQVKRINNLPNGDLDLDHFEQLIKEKKPALVSVTHIPTSSGTIQDVESVGKICADHDIIYLIDACQSIGQLNVDVKKLNCDFLSVTGRKFLRGPRGTGFLFVSDRILDQQYAPLYIDMRGAQWSSKDSYKFIIEGARRFELWEVSYASLIGLKEAIKYANDIGMDKIEQRNKQLLSNFRNDLLKLDGVELYDRGTNTSAIFTIQKRGKSMQATQEHLVKHKVYFSTTMKEYAIVDFTNKGIDWAIRLSPHYFNTTEELDQIISIIESL